MNWNPKSYNPLLEEKKILSPSSVVKQWEEEKTVTDEGKKKLEVLKAKCDVLKFQEFSSTNIVYTPFQLYPTLLLSIHVEAWEQNGRAERYHPAKAQTLRNGYGLKAWQKNLAELFEIFSALIEN